MNNGVIVGETGRNKSTVEKEEDNLEKHSSKCNLLW